MGNIKTYDWTSDEGLLQKRSVIYEEFYKDGKKHYKLVDDLKPEEHRAPIIEAEGYDDILKIIEVEPDKEKMDDIYIMIIMSLRDIPNLHLS